MSSSDITPSQTLYLKNLNSKINIDELKRSLYCLFSTYGHILDINARYTEKMREQAFVVFSNVESAAAALKALDGFVFYERPLAIEYAKTKSDAVAKLDGTFRLRTRKPDHTKTNAVVASSTTQ